MELCSAVDPTPLDYNFLRLTGGYAYHDPDQGDWKRFSISLPRPMPVKRDPRERTTNIPTSVTWPYSGMGSHAPKGVK